MGVSTPTVSKSRLPSSSAPSSPAFRAAMSSPGPSPVRARPPPSPSLSSRSWMCRSASARPSSWRLLAKQIQKVVVALGDYMKIECMACIGGTLVREDMRKLEGGVHVVVGTPGRVYDMINRRALDPASMRQFVLDEADEMLSRGFKDQIYDIFRLLPGTTQVILLSAT